MAKVLFGRGVGQINNIENVPTALSTISYYGTIHLMAQKGLKKWEIVPFKILDLTK